MRVEDVDERDSCWERHQSRFRVYFFRGRPLGAWVSTHDVTDATFAQTMAWAEETVGADLYAIALVSSDDEGRRGLVWLHGLDVNDNHEPFGLDPEPEPAARLRREMLRHRRERLRRERQRSAGLADPPE
ncbi:hypothetical protein [Arthrobacter sp. 35W]|uniref:hypothetical protein n=1 Tax=Arthrobacter sp. 35W TaxID=1132441 RepID=UPI00041139B6|nr:hypothetical protein [Arthrobacter sp. 35W]